MAKAVKVTFVLVGPRAGQDFKPYEDIEFKKGEFEFAGSSDQVEGLENLLRVTHNAHQKGSHAHAAAEKAWVENPLHPENVKKALEVARVEAAKAAAMAAAALAVESKSQTAAAAAK